MILGRILKHYSDPRKDLNNPGDPRKDLNNPSDPQKVITIICEKYCSEYRKVLNNHSGPEKKVLLSFILIHFYSFEKMRALILRLKKT